VKTCMLLASVLSMVLAFGALHEDVKAQPNAPSVLYIVLDDADAETMERYMPRTTALVRDEGADFSNFYVAQAQCCPSRATALLGEYPHNHGVEGNQSPNGGYFGFREAGHEARTIGVEMQEQGYITGLHGKYLNEYTTTDVPPGWSKWFAKHGQKQYDWQATFDGNLLHFGTGSNAYADDVTFRRANTWISGVEAPWFEYLSPTGPHSPYDDPPIRQSGFEETFVRPPNFNELDVSDKPEHIRALPRFGGAELREVEDRHMHRARMVANIDDRIADTIGNLEASGKLANTYVVITSDNGWHEGEHRKTYSKGTPYEESAKVPLWIRGPGISPGTQVDSPASNVDLFATFAEIAGSVESRDGVSLLSLAQGEGTGRQRILIEGVPGSGHDFNALREQSDGRDLKYVEYESGEEELYDLDADPWELQSLHESADLLLLAELRLKLAALKDCSGADCRGGG